jgi:hypothetical protein
MRTKLLLRRGLLNMTSASRHPTFPPSLGNHRMTSRGMAMWKRSISQRRLIAVCMAAWGALLLGGCEEVWPTPIPTPQIVVTKEERPPGWLDQLLKTLPEDDAGVPDMTQALDQNLIQPQGGSSPRRSRSRS